MQTIYLDISNKGVVPTIYAKQGDVGRKFEVVFTDSGIPYSIPTNAKISIWYEGDSGVGNYTYIGENSAIAIGENKAVVELITQMLSEDGEGIVCLVMNAGNNQIGSWNIRYLCERVPGFDGEGAKEYYTAFSKTVESLKQVTENLTPEAIGAAPAGFGLGEEVKTVTSIDNLLVPGQYKFYNGGYPLIAGVSETSYCDVEVVSSGSGCIHRITAITGGYRAERTYNGTTFGEWEWVNPPMTPNTEYRTTERWNNEPVYTKLVAYTPSGTIGNTESSADILIPHGITGFNRLVRVDATVFYTMPLPVVTADGFVSTAVTAVNNQNIELRINKRNWNAAHPFTFALYYTK